MLGRLLLHNVKYINKLERQSTVVRSFSVLCDQTIKFNNNSCCWVIDKQKIRPVVYVNDRKCSTEAVQIISKPFYQGFAKTIADSDVVLFMQKSIIYLHDTTGLPWWATFCLLPVILKTCFLPFDILKTYNESQIIKTQKQFRESGRVDELRYEANCNVMYKKWPKKRAQAHYERTMSREFKELCVKNNCSLGKNWIILYLRFPIWLCATFAVRNLCLPYPVEDIETVFSFFQIKEESFLWIPSLVEADVFILPVTLGVLNYLLLELSLNMAPTRPKTFAVKLSKAFGFLMIPISAMMPSALPLYWLSNSITGFGENIIFRSPKTRKILRIPEENYAHVKPLSQVLITIKDDHINGFKRRRDSLKKIVKFAKADV